MLANNINTAFYVLSVSLFLLPFVISPFVEFALGITKRGELAKSFILLRRLWRKDIAFKSQILTLLTWISQGLVLYLMLQNFSVEVSILMAISIYCLSLLIGAASLIPSGIGVTEVGMIWLLTQIGIEKDVAIVISLTTRMLTLWPAVFIGLVCSFSLNKN